ncbi:hypothetical protein [Chryseobacterium sp.]|uniref:hypothetical protein n=1 Tax=Chryseobacterium sp. TaxID=1871047 RepID=UPI0035C6EB51
MNFVDPFRMTNVEEIKRFQTQSFFMMMIILRKQSYADFICDEACVLAPVLLGFFFLIISNTLLRSMTDVVESWAFSNAKFFFMMVFILRKQSYADFICDEACVLASVFLWFFL